MGSAGGGHPSVWEHLLGQPEQTPLLFAAPMIPPGVGSRAWSPHMGHSRGQTPQTWAQLILNCWDQRRHPRCCSSGAKLSEAQTPRGGHDAHAGASAGGDTRQQEGCCRRDRGCRGGRVWGRMAVEGKGGLYPSRGARPICPSASGCRVLARCRRGWGCSRARRGFEDRGRIRRVWRRTGTWG